MIHHGDCLDVLRTIPDSSVDAVITDPPAGIAFMGKAWDKDKGGRSPWIAWMTEVMRECLRVLKPGAHGLVWALPRTSHWTATALEDAGFDVREVITHLFGTGFPKSLDVSKAIDKAARAEREIVGHKGGRYNYAFSEASGAPLGNISPRENAPMIFYCAKASKRDRGAGNVHPCVKSTQLMRYLCRLITPPGGTVLDPFAGSGSTGVAALAEGFTFVGIEQELDYVHIARKRLETPPLVASEIGQ